MSKSCVALLLLLASFSAKAQEEPKPLVIEGYGEMYYGFDFNQPANGNRPDFVVSHNRHNEVNINLALLRAMYEKDRVRANIGMMAGTYANRNMREEPGLLRNIYEANTGYRLHKLHEIWIDAGIFSSHIGSEGALSMDCPTLTRSMVADATPYYEAGARLSYTSMKDKWYLALMHLNGWQRIQRPNGYSSPAGGMQLRYSPNKKLLFNLSTFVGSDRPDIDDSRRYFLDFYTVIKPTKNLEVTWTVDLGREDFIIHGTNNNYGLNQWMGTSLALLLKTGARTSWSARGEYFDAPVGNTVISMAMLNSTSSFRVGAYSLGYNRQLAKNLLWRTEGKGYVADSELFRRGNAMFNDNYVLTTSLAVRFNNRKSH